MSKEDIRITEVDSHQKLAEFIDFPGQIYRDNPYWVPPLKSEFRKYRVYEMGI